MSDTPPILFMFLPLPLLVGTLAGVIVGFATGSWLWAVVAFAAVALAIGIAAFFAAEWLALRLLRARPLAAGGSQMLRNQLEELCARAGVAEPNLYTVGAGAPAIASVGRAKRALVVTDGLADSLTVVELEAAVARELARSRSGATIVDTLAVPFITVPFSAFGNLANRALRFFRGGDHDARVDLDGIAITRYPPGLTAALAKMTQIPADASAAVSHLWATGTSSADGAIGVYGVDERLELLREL